MLPWKVISAHKNLGRQRGNVKRSILLAVVALFMLPGLARSAPITGVVIQSCKLGNHGIWVAEISCLPPRQTTLRDKPLTCAPSRSTVPFPGESTLRVCHHLFTAQPITGRDSPTFSCALPRRVVKGKKYCSKVGWISVDRPIRNPEDYGDAC